MATETLAYTSALTGATITFGDTSLPNVAYKGLTGAGMAPLDHFAVDTAYQPGSVFVRTKKKTSVLKALLSVYGNQSAADIRQSLWSTIDAILAVMEPASTSAGTLVKTTSDGVSRQLNNVQYVGGFEVEDQAANRAYITLELVFEAMDPTWYSTTLHATALGASSDPYGFSVPLSVPLNINGQAQATTPITNAGNINASPIFTFYGPCTNYSVTNGTTGLSFAITQPLYSGDQLVVDTKQGAVTYTPSGGTPAPLYSAFAGNRQWVVLAPGVNQLTFNRDVAGNNQCTVTWRDTWNHG